MLSSKWWNNKASDIKLVYLYSTQHTVMWQDQIPTLMGTLNTFYNKIYPLQPPKISYLLSGGSKFCNLKSLSTAISWARAILFMPLAAVIISSKDTNFGGDAATPGIINPWEVFCLQEIKQHVSQSLRAKYSLNSSFLALYYSCNEVEYRNYSVVYHLENQLSKQCGTVVVYNLLFN